LPQAHAFFAANAFSCHAPFEYIEQVTCAWINLVTQRFLVYPQIRCCVQLRLAVDNPERIKIVDVMIVEGAD
jgi:hypothetical protein